MREENTDATNHKSAIQCIEVLISRSYLRNSGHNLFWTLSVYSLENQPVKKDRSLHNSEIFHFMTYDWNRTIKKLLDDHKVPYAVIQNFAADNISGGIAGASITLFDPEDAFLSAASSLAEHLSVTDAGLAARLGEQKQSLMLDETLP